MNKQLIKISKSSYFHNFIIVFSGIVGLRIAFWAFGLNIFNSYSDLLCFLGILILFGLFVFVSEKIFSWIKIHDFFDSLWIGVGLFCWSPIINLPWKENFLLALKGFPIYFLIGFVILLIGYLFRKSVRRKH